MTTKIMGERVEVEARKRRPIADFFSAYAPRSIDYPGVRLLDGLKAGVAYGHVPSALLDVFRHEVLNPQQADLLTVVAVYGEGRKPTPAAITEWMEEKGKLPHVTNFATLAPVAPDVTHQILMLFQVRPDSEANRDRQSDAEEDPNFNPYRPSTTAPMGEYVWLWYDPDHPDCAMGRFETRENASGLCAHLAETMTARAAIRGGLVVLLHGPAMRDWASY
jgi:hypothetical protein